MKQAQGLNGLLSTCIACPAARRQRVKALSLAEPRRQLEHYTLDRASEALSINGQPPQRVVHAGPALAVSRAPEPILGAPQASAGHSNSPHNTLLHPFGPVRRLAGLKRIDRGRTGRRKRPGPLRGVSQRACGLLPVTEDFVRARVPPGVQVGQRLRLRGEGDVQLHAHEVRHLAEAVAHGGHMQVVPEGAAVTPVVQQPHLHASPFGHRTGNTQPFVGLIIMPVLCQPDQDIPTMIRSSHGRLLARCALHAAVLAASLQ